MSRAGQQLFDEIIADSWNVLERYGCQAAAKLATLYTESTLNARRSIAVYGAFHIGASPAGDAGISKKLIPSDSQIGLPPYYYLNDQESTEISKILKRGTATKLKHQ